MEYHYVVERGYGFDLDKFSNPNLLNEYLRNNKGNLAKWQINLLTVLTDISRQDNLKYLDSFYDEVMHYADPLDFVYYDKQNLNLLVISGPAKAIYIPDTSRVIESSVQLLNKQDALSMLVEVWFSFAYNVATESKNQLALDKLDKNPFDSSTNKTIINYLMWASQKLNWHFENYQTIVKIRSKS